MVIQYLAVFFAAFLIVFASGKHFIPWLEKHNAKQPLKEEVKDKVYTDQNEECDEKPVG